MVQLESLSVTHGAHKIQVGAYFGRQTTDPHWTEPSVAVLLRQRVQCASANWCALAELQWPLVHCGSVEEAAKNTCLAVAAEVAAGCGQSEELAAVLRLPVRQLTRCAPEDCWAPDGKLGA